MDRKQRTVPEQLGKIAVGFAEITKKMHEEKSALTPKKKEIKA